MQELNKIVDKVNEVDAGINNIIVPILKETIRDSNLHNKRLFISNIILILVILVVGITAMILTVYQNNRYAEFLSQFDKDTVIQSTNERIN